MYIVCRNCHFKEKLSTKILKQVGFISGVGACVGGLGFAAVSVFGAGVPVLLLFGYGFTKFVKETLNDKYHCPKCGASNWTNQENV